MKNKPWYQSILKSYVPWIIAGITAVSGIAESISNLGIISPFVTYAGTFLVILGLIIGIQFLKSKPLVWVTEDGQTTRIKALGFGTWLLAGGIVIALWIPRLFTNHPSSSPTEVATTIVPSATFGLSTPAVVQPPYRGDIGSCQDFVVIPFLKKIRLVFYKPSEDTVVRLTYYDEYNIAHSLESGIAYGNFDLSVDDGYYLFGANESYVINNPYSGTWVIESNNCGGIDTYYEPIIAFGGDRLIVEPITNSPINSYYIKYSAIVNDEYRLRPPENPDFAFQVVTKVVRPDKTITSYEMEWIKSDELFVSKDTIDFSQSGEYKVDVIVYLPNCDLESAFRIGEIPAVCKGLQEYHKYSESYSVP